MLPPPSEASVISVKDLGKAYAPGQFAIRGVNLDVGRRDFIVIIGRSGAGKSTFLRCLNLLVRPTEGTIRLNGVDVTRCSGKQLREVRGRVGMIFQGFNLVRRLSVLDNVLSGRLRFRRSPWGLLTSMLHTHAAAERERAFECLKKVQIEHLAYRRADTLSGGQQQRVAIARVLAQEPTVILADEPIASLDPQSAESVMRTLRHIHESGGIPVIVNLHQVDIARAFASRIVGMARGSIQVDAAPSDLSESAVEAVYTQGTGPTAKSSTDAGIAPSAPAIAMAQGVQS
jgi:phosphonate transport system ATP-binding protein